MHNGTSDAVIHIDCDGELALSNHYGKSFSGEKDSVYPALNLFLDIFKRNGIKATLFVVGKDIENELKREIIQRALNEGHELSNHTYSHPGSFSRLSTEEKIFEISKAQEIFKRYFNQKAYGFRAPNFEAGTELIEILNKLGFAYDSSLLPTPYSPVIRQVKSIFNRLCVQKDISYGYLSSILNCLASRYPYIPSDEAIWKRKKQGFEPKSLIEIPVTVSPVLKIPCHASYSLAYPLNIGYFITSMSIRWAIKHKIPFVYVFHISELCENKDLYYLESRLYGSILDRIKFVEWLCKKVSEDFNCITTKELSKKYNNLQL